MKSHSHKIKRKKSKPVTNDAPKKQRNNESTAQLIDNRSEAVAQRKLKEQVDNSSRAKQLKAIQELANQKAMRTAQRMEKQEEDETLQGKFASARKKTENRTAQRMEEEEEEEKPVQGKFKPGNQNPNNQLPTTNYQLPATDSAVQRKNNTGLPDNLKTGVEKLSGMDMSDVKVHYNSDKPSQLQAHAYAQGSDIHLAPGKEKHLPHETWHVAQQKQGRVKPTKQLKSGVNINDDSGLEKEADIKGQAALQAFSGSRSVMQAKTNSGKVIQRNKTDEIKVEGLTFYKEKDHKIWYNITDSGKIKNQDHVKYYKIYEGEGNRRFLDQWKTLGLGTGILGRLKDDTDTIDTVDDVVGQVTSPLGDMIGYEGISGISDKMLGRTVKTDTGGKDEYSKKELKIFGKSTGKSRKEVGTGLGVAPDTIGGITGVTGFIKGLKDMSDSDKETHERFVAFLEGSQGVSSMGESVSKLTTRGTGKGGKFGSGFEMIASGFGAIKDGFLAVKKIFWDVKDTDLSTSEKRKGAREGLFHSLEAAKSVFLALKSYRELATGSASGKLMESIPGLGIAIAALKLITQAYYAIQSYTHYIIMDAREEELVKRTKVKGKKDKDTKGKRKFMDDASEFYRKNDALISNKQKLIEEDGKEIKVLEKEAIRTGKHPKRISKLKKRVTRLIGEIEVLKGKKYKQSLKHKDGLMSKESLSEYTLVKELKSGNLKRIKRQGVHIASEMARIAADVMILTGVGGLAGGITKGIAGSVDLALPTVRLAKQTGRDRAGREEAKKSVKNPVKFHSSFDTSKTSIAKKDFRLDQVRTLIKMGIALGNKKYRSGGEMQSDYLDFNMYLSATGVDLSTLFKYNGDPDKQITELFKALSAREL